jgi:hypothetical protein
VARVREIPKEVVGRVANEDGGLDLHEVTLSGAGGRH